MSKILNEVIKDFEKQTDKTYCLLYALVNLLPSKYVPSVKYDELDDELYIHTVHIGKLYDIVEIKSDARQKGEVKVIKFERIIGSICQTKRVVFYVENGKLTIKGEEWIDKEVKRYEFGSDCLTLDTPIGDGDMPL